MDKRDILVEKIKKEYESYIEKLKQCSFDEIIENSEQISIMKLVKDYILNGYVAHGDEVEFLVEFNTPLEAICSGFEASDEDIMDTLQEAINEARYYKENVAQTPEYIQNLAEKILSGMTNVSDFLSPQGEITDAELMSLVSEMTSVLTEEDARFLMQFKKPLDVMNDLVPTAESEKKDIDAALEKMRNSDIYTMPYSLDSDNVLPEAKFRHNAINSINSIVPMPDFNITANWLKFCREVLLDGSEPDDVNPYYYMVEAMRTVAYEQGTDILQKLYDMGDEACILPNQIKKAASYLENGGNIERIPYLAENGHFNTNEPDILFPDNDEELEM